MGKWIKVRLVRGLAGKPKKQKIIVYSLGLKKPNQERILPDNPCTRGMVNKVSHLVKIVEEGEGDVKA